MKKSEQLRIEAGSIESDIKYLGAANKIMRAEREERFEENILPELRKRFVVEENENFIRIDTQEYGTITIYPKANKLNIHKGNRWIKRGGVRWIINNLLK